MALARIERVPSGLEQVNVTQFIPLVNPGGAIPGGSRFVMLLFTGHLTYLVMEAIFELRCTAAGAADNVLSRGAQAFNSHVFNSPARNPALAPTNSRP
jgi:hypothetical protein